ncbi:MAG: regulatory protein RecX [Spongiibacteraceae bacterium]
MDDISATDIRRAAMDLLARREHSKRELQQKLALRFSNRDLIEQEIQRLCDEHLQSDARFAEAYLHARAQRLYGPQRIKAELKERGISPDVIATAFRQSNIDWSANLRKLEINKFGSTPPADVSARAKRIRFLQYRGFSGIPSGDIE